MGIREEILGRVSGQTVLVTGGSGAIGLQVARRLVELGAKPIIFDLHPHSPYFADIENEIVTVQGDLLDLDLLEKTLRERQVTQTIHLAKMTGGSAEENPYRALQVNVVGSGNVLEAARRAGIRRVVFSSSKSVYAPFTGPYSYPELAPITEDYPKFSREDVDYVPFYTTTNKMVEYFGIRFAKKYEMEFVILRFGNTYGPGKLDTRRRNRPGQGPMKVEGTLAAMVIEAAFYGEQLHLGEGGGQQDDLVYNADLADGIIAATVSNRIQFHGNWREIHLARGEATALSRIVDAVKRRFPEAPVEVGPGPFTMYEHRKAQAVFDISRAREELGYEPQYDVERAIDDYMRLLELRRTTKPDRKG